MGIVRGQVGAGDIAPPAEFGRSGVCEDEEQGKYDEMAMAFQSRHLSGSPSVLGLPLLTRSMVAMRV